jgi:coenzyme F420-reducing hydrogenase beta subunit
MPETTVEPAADWTCARCEVTVSWMADVERPELPGTWISEDGELYCLACRRERAGEEALAGLGEETSAGRRQQVESRARVDFEMKRRPEQADNRIAKVCHTSVKVVKQARVRLGLQSRRPA